MNYEKTEHTVQRQSIHCTVGKSEGSMCIMLSFSFFSRKATLGLALSIRLFVCPSIRDTISSFSSLNFLNNQLSHSQTLLRGYLKRSILHPPSPHKEVTLEIALSISPLVSPFVTPFHQEPSRSTLLINQLYLSIDFNHHSSFEL